MQKRLRGVFVVACGALVLGACAPTEGSIDPSGAGAGGGGGSAGTGGGGGGSGGGAGGVLIDSGLDDSAQEGGGCAAISEQGKVTPLELYILLDRSASMVGDKWAAATTGLDTFVADAKSAGIDVALGVLPRPGLSTCDPTPFETPDVPFGVLPGAGGALSAALAGFTPTGIGTPIYPALAGALSGVSKVVAANPGHSGAVLLVTDGAPQGPTQCSGGVNAEDVQVIANVAHTAYASTGGHPSVTTFVVGLPGVDQTFANQVAAAGGSTSAVLATSPTNVQAQFAAALAQVRGAALPCTFVLPDKVSQGTIAYDRVNVVYTHGDGVTREPQAQVSDCSSAGWRYDDAAHPTEIVLCPDLCDAVHHDLGATIDIALGCQTIVK